MSINPLKYRKMEDTKAVVAQEKVEELPLSAEDQARLNRLEQLKEEAYQLAKPMLDKMQARSQKKGESIIIARMGSAFSFR